MKMYVTSNLGTDSQAQLKGLKLIGFYKESGLLEATGMKSAAVCII